MKSGTGCVRTFFLEFLVRQTLLLEQHLREKEGERRCFNDQRYRGEARENRICTWGCMNDADDRGERSWDMDQ